MNPLAEALARLLLLASPAVLMPLGLPLLPAGAGGRCLALAGRAHAPAAALLAFALLLAPAGGLGIALATPWLLVAALRAIAGARHLLRQRSIEALGDAAALGYPLVGAGWALCAAGSLQPLGFSQTIVLLTAVHFHHAGFALPLATAQALRRAPSLLARLAVGGVVLGMPLTAAGITSTQLGGPHAVEVAAAAATAGFGVLAAALHLLAALDHRLPDRARARLGVAGAALAAAMALALLYAFRAELGLFTDAPAALAAMTATHGVLNGAVFGPCALLGWRATA